MGAIVDIQQNSVVAALWCLYQLGDIEFIRDRFADQGIASPDGPIVAVNANASDPHYEPSADRHSAIKQGDWLLIDLWAKGLAEGSVYADIT